MNDILEAAKFAAQAHAGQTRDDEITDYFRGHVVRVAAEVMVDPNIACNTSVCAAFLHDTIEDCGVLRETIQNKFGTAVLNIVWELTSSSKQDEYLAKQHGMTYIKPPRAERKRADAAYLATVSITSKTIKLIDRIENLIDTLKESTPMWALRYAEESLYLHDTALAGVDALLSKKYLDLVDNIQRKYAKLK